jgi:hypothetical protein
LEKHFRKSSETFGEVEKVCFVALMFDREMMGNSSLIRISGEAVDEIAEILMEFLGGSEVSV